MALVSYFLIYDYPDTAGFLSAEEKELWLARLKASGDATDVEPFTWQNVVNALSDISVWLYAVQFIGMSLPLYTLSLFLPTIIKNLGYSNAAAQLLTVPPYALGFLTTITIAHLSFLFNLRSPFIIWSCIFAAIGYIVLLSDLGSAAQYAGVMIATAGIYPATAIVLSWPANNASGQTKRAVACALQISVGILGGAVVGSQMYRPSQSPGYKLGHGMALGFLTIAAVSAALQYLLLKRRNADKALRRSNSGQTDATLTESAAVNGHETGDRSVNWTYQL